MQIQGLWAVVPAGGAGTRLWPLSRAGHPKFLHDLTGEGDSLLEQTYARLRPLTDDRMLIVTGTAHREAVSRQLTGLATDQIIAEPSPRDSMAAIGVAAAVLERRAEETGEDLVLGSFAADHVIEDAAAFAEAVGAAAVAAREDWLVTIGIAPTYPSPAFGYIRQGEPLQGHPNTRAVREFVEKPSVSVAEEYVASGDYRWNAGMFVVRPGVLLDLLAEQDPEFADRLREIGRAPERIIELWERLPRIAIDHAIAEPAAAAGRVAMVPGRFGWDDVGDFDSLAGLLGEPEHLQVLGEQSHVVGLDSSGVVVPVSDRMIAVVGLDDVVVVDTPDALLVTTRRHAQNVKQVVAELRRRGRSDLA